MARRHLDMVGVVGSSPIVPTKQNPSSTGLRGRSEGVAFFVFAKLFQYFCKTAIRLEFQASLHMLVNHLLLRMPILIIGGHFRGRMAQQRLHILRRETLLLVQP